ncbi:MAG: DMT family transporter [Inhella sp.]
MFTLPILRSLGVERLAWAQWLGVAVAAAGALAYTADKLLGGQPGAWAASAGDGVLLLAAALFSYYSVASKPLIQAHGGVAVLAYGTLLGTLPTLAYCAPSMAAVPWGQLPAWAWAGTLWSVIGGGFIGWLAWGYAGAQRSVGRTAPLIYLMPVVAGLSSWFFVDEAFGLHKLGSGAHPGRRGAGAVRQPQATDRQPAWRMKPTPAQTRRLRELYRSAGWPCQDSLELELLAAGWLERLREADGRERLRLTDAGIQAAVQGLPARQSRAAQCA